MADIGDTEKQSQYSIFVPRFQKIWNGLLMGMLLMQGSLLRTAVKRGGVTWHIRTSVHFLSF